MQHLRRFAVAIALALVAVFSITPAKAQDIGDWGENNFIDQVFRAQTWTIAANLDFALLTTACSDSALGTEVSGGNYARQSVARSLANFAGTQSAGSTTASTGTGGQTSNNAAISWGTVTWAATVTHFAVLSGSNILVCRALTTSRTVASGDQVSFAIGAFTFTIQ